MRPLALLVALIIIAIGIVGVAAPDRLIGAGQYLLTPLGLYGIAALRIAMGLVLMLVARTSRAPRTLRVLGAVVLVAGLTTPLFGVDRARGIADWAATQGLPFLRGAGVGLLVVGGFIAFAVGTGRRTA